MTIFLLFSTVPEAVGELFAFYFFPFAVGGGGFSGWCGIEVGWGRVPSPIPPPPVSRYGWERPGVTAHFEYNTIEKVCLQELMLSPPPFESSMRQGTKGVTK